MILLTLKRSLCLLITLSFTLTSCNIFDRSRERVVITVGKRSISDDELRRDVQHIIFEMGITLQEAKLGIEPIINKVIEKSLILEYGKEESIVVTDDELKSAIRDIKRDYPEGVFQKMLLQRYIDFDEWKEGLRQELLIKKNIIRATSGITPITFDETKKYFNSYRNEFRHPQMVQVRQIVTHSKEEAEMILEHLAKGHEMSELAKKYSITPEAEDGGILGWIAKGEQEESFEKIIFSLPVGKISNIFKSPSGYHIFKVLSIRNEGLKELPEVMAEIESKLILQKREFSYKRWIQELKDRFPVWVEKEIYTDWSLEG
ncbi:peptidylprolyl isomerase [Thermodesulfobacteriota bacterium]